MINIRDQYTNLFSRWSLLKCRHLQGGPTNIAANNETKQTVNILFDCDLSTYVKHPRFQRLIQLFLLLVGFPHNVVAHLCQLCLQSARRKLAAVCNNHVVARTTKRSLRRFLAASSHRLRLQLLFGLLFLQLLHHTDSESKFGGI
eukprot:GHVU01106682.1.p2 GENE.GHVU01106682.1~~GHVU01106682.1.p2  ORF type:complete len:145 (+),score=12.20 GHVU01106682.1:1854-2288(+)